MPAVVFFIGQPGGGKTTQCLRFVRRFPEIFVHISTGDVLRAEAANPSSPVGAEIAALINGGNLVPPALVVRLLRRKMEELPEGRVLLLDGFPRNVIQAEAWDGEFGAWNPAVNLAVYLTCPEEVCTDRLLARGLTSGRADDANREVIGHRFQVMAKETDPVVALWQAQGKITEVDGNDTLEVVEERLEKLLREHKFIN